MKKKRIKPSIKYIADPGPVQNLLKHLHSKMTLTEAFDPNIFPMLGAWVSLRKHTLEKTKRTTEMVLETAYWIETGYLYVLEEYLGKGGLPVMNVVDLFPPGYIALDPNGFFNRKSNNKIYRMAKNTVFVPFSTDNFSKLKLSAPEANALANCILAEDRDLSQQKTDMMKLTGHDKLDKCAEIFGKEVWQCLPQVIIASYLGFTPVHLSNLLKERIYLHRNKQDN